MPGILLYGRMRFDDVYLFLKFKVEINKCDHVQISTGEQTLRTYMSTNAPWLSQRPEFEPLVMLYSCCTAAVVVTVAACLLSKSRGSVGLYRPAAQHPCTSLEIMCSFL